MMPGGQKAEWAFPVKDAASAADGVVAMRLRDISLSGCGYTIFHAPTGAEAVLAP